MGPCAPGEWLGEDTLSIRMACFLSEAVLSKPDSSTMLAITASPEAVQLLGVGPEAPR